MKDGRIPIKILNTREEEVKLIYFNITMDNLENYEICSFDKENQNAERVKKIVYKAKFRSFK